MSEDLNHIRGYVATLVRRERALLLARVGLQAVLLLVVALLLASVAAGWHWHRGWSTAALVAWLGIGGWALVAVPLLVRWRETGDRLRQARIVEGMRPDLRGRLLTAVERADGPRGGESPLLLGLVARRAAEAVRAVEPRAVHPGRSIRRLVLATGTLWLVGFVASVLVPGGPAGTFRWWLGGSSALAEVVPLDGDAEAERARVGDIVLRYVYPEYTGLDPREVPNSTGDAHGPPGTVVEVSLKTAERTEAAALVHYDEPPLEARVEEEGRRIRSRFTIGADPGTWHLVIYRHGEGQDSKEFSITPQPDLPPEVMVEVDDGVLKVALDATFHVPWRARDDYGIRSVRLDVEGREAPIAPLARPEQRLAEVHGVLGSRPVDLGLRAGDTVTLEVVARDNDTWSGSKEGRSTPIRLVVLGPRGEEAENYARFGEIRDEMLEVLADHLEDPWPPGDTAGSLARWGETVAERYAPLDSLLDQYRRDLQSAERFDNRMIEDVVRTGRELVRYTQVAFRPGDPAAAPIDSVLTCADLRDGSIVSLEDAILAFDRLIRARALRRVVEHTQKLARTAEAIEEMLKAEDVDAQEMLVRLDRLERMMEELAQLAAELEEGGLQEFVNTRTSEMKSLADEIRKALAEGRLDDARKMMERLAEQLRQMSEGVEDQLKREQQEGEEGAKQAQALQEELKKLEQEQRELQARLQELREQHDGKNAEKAEQLWQQAEQLATEVLELAEGYRAGLEEANRGFHERQRTDDAVVQSERLRDAVRARDIQRSREKAREVETAWRMAEGTYRFEQERRGGRIPGPGLREIGRVQAKAAELRELLERLEQVAEQVPQQVAERTREMSEQQQDLQQRLQEARQQAREVARQMPMRPKGMEESLEEADGQMQQAGSEMQQGQPMQAEGAQGAAADRIADARRALEQAQQDAEQMQRAMQQGGPGGQGQESGQAEGSSEDRGGRGRPESQQVAIPSREEFRTPEEYRRELLEGMQGEVPEEYRSLKKRYYEELVRQ